MCSLKASVVVSKKQVGGDCVALLFSEEVK